MSRVCCCLSACVSGGFVLAAVALLAACAEDGPAGPVTFNVRYELAATGLVAFDSVKYDDGAGTLVKVAAPPVGWSVVLEVSDGGTLQAQVWAVAGGSGFAKLRVSWTLSGVSTAADSSMASPSAPQNFSLSIPRRVL